MGIIKNQGLKQSFVTYIGVLMGVVNNLYIFPKMLDVDELGLYRFLIDSALLLFPFIGLGVHNLSVRMFPKFKNEKNGHQGFLLFLLMGAAAGYVIFLILAWLGSDFIKGLLQAKGALIQQYWPYILPLTALTLIAAILTQWTFNFKKIVLPAVFNDLYLKFGMPSIILLYGFGVVTLQQSLLLVIVLFVLTVVSLVGYIKYLGEWIRPLQWSFYTKEIINEIKTYSFYGVLGSIGSVLSSRIDIFMVALLAADDLTSVGVYTTAFFIINIISVPARAINNIASPIIAESNETNDLTNIEMIYKKSSIILLTIGSFFLIGIWASVDDLFSLMPKGDQFAAGKYVILILGIGKLIDLATGINSQIISYSKYFRFNFYAVLILAVVNIIANFILIPRYQINGAAIATALSLVLFNASKYFFIKQKMGMQPFTMQTVKLIAIALVTLAVSLLVPSTGMTLLDIVVRSAAISMVFLPAVYYLQINKDLNELVDQMLSKIGVKLP